MNTYHLGQILHNVLIKGGSLRRPVAELTCPDSILSISLQSKPHISRARSIAEWSLDILIQYLGREGGLEIEVHRNYVV